MTRQPFDPRELGERDPAVERTAAEIERYAEMASDEPSASFVERVMGAVDLEAEPRRGLGAWLASRFDGMGRLRRPLQGLALAVVVLLAAGGTLLAGQLAGLLRNPMGTSPPPVTTSPRPSPSENIRLTPSPKTSASPTESVSPSTGATEGTKPSVSETSTAAPTRSASPSSETPGATESETPQPSGSDGSHGADG
jgi:hypothetical protein